MPQFLLYLKNLFSFLLSIVVPASAYLNFLNIPKEKAVTFKFFSNFSNIFYSLLLASTIMLIICAYVYLFKKKNYIPPTVIINKKEEEEKEKKVKQYNLRIFVGLLISSLIFLVSGYLYVQKNMIPEKEKGILGFEFGNQVFDGRLRNELKNSLGNENIPFEFLQKSANGLKGLSPENFFKANDFKSGLFFEGNYSAGKLPSIQCELHWYGDYNLQKFPFSIKDTLKTSRLLLDNCKIEFPELDAKIVARFILGYIYAHDTNTINKAKEQFTALEMDTSFQKKVADAEIGSPLVDFNETIISLSKFVAEVERLVKRIDPKVKNAFTDVNLLTIMDLAALNDWYINIPNFSNFQPPFILGKSKDSLVILKLNEPRDSFSLFSPNHYKIETSDYYNMSAKELKEYKRLNKNLPPAGTYKTYIPIIKPLNELDTYLEKQYAGLKLYKTN